MAECVHKWPSQRRFNEAPAWTCFECGERYENYARGRIAQLEQEKAAARPCAIIGNQVTVSFDTAEQAQRYYDSLRAGE